MNRKEKLRQRWAEESKEDQQQEQRIRGRMEKWGRATAVLGLAFVMSVVIVVPFLAGYPLHERWDMIGKRVLQLSMGLFMAFTYVGGTYLTFWFYLRKVKQIHRKFAPRQNQEE